VTGTPSCPPSGGAASVPPMWTHDDHACPVPATTGGGCGAGSVCIEKSAAPYDVPACISQAGTVACPGDWPSSIAAYSGGSDSRGCDACTCATSGVACSGGKFTVFDDDNCGNGGSTAPVDISGGACISVQDHVDNDQGSYRATAATLSGSCNPGGGAPHGEVSPEGAITFCCR